MGARGRLTGLLALEADRRRPFLWLPVAMAGGIVAYFSVEPPPGFVSMAALSGIAVVLAVLCGGRPLLVALLAACAAAAAGAALAAYRTASVAAPVLARPMTAMIAGFVEAAEARGTGGRLLLRLETLADLTPETMPHRVRVTLAAPPVVRAGDFVVVRARLVPPPQPSRPGGYDFAREAWFQQIGAVGSVIGDVTVTAPPREVSPAQRASAAIDRARNALTDRIVSVIGGPSGAVAASLVTGKRGLIPEDTNEALRAAGIYHVVSISGLHMVLAAGMVFWFVRAALAASPTLALRWPLRKIAATAAILAGGGYNLFAGAEIATQRALVMTAALFAAMLVDRAAISMRNLAFAALAILALEPESVLGPSFQMSFAAVAALIALYERTGAGAAALEAGGAQPNPGRPDVQRRGLVQKGLALAAGTVAATLVAEAATAPFGLFHFQRYTAYGLVGNALTLPLVSLLVMPMALLGAVTYPLGIDQPFWAAMGIGVQAMLSLSATVAGWPGARGILPAFDADALMLMVFGFLCLVIWTTALRWVGLAPVAIGILLATRTDRPDVVITADGQSAMVRQASGRLSLAGRSPGPFVVDQWLRADGDARAVRDPSLADGVRCDRLGCVARMPDGQAVAVVLRGGAFDDDCPRAAVLVAPLSAPAHCRPPLLFDLDALRPTGAVAVRVRDGRRSIETVRRPGARRPWSTAVALPREGPLAEAPDGDE